MMKVDHDVDYDELIMMGVMRIRVDYDELIMMGVDERG